MNITAKASTLRSALSQALTSLAASKPQETVTIEPSPAAVTIHGTKDAGYPLLRAKGETSAALCALLGIDQQASGGDSADTIQSLQSMIAALTKDRDMMQTTALNFERINKELAKDIERIRGQRDDAIAIGEQASAEVKRLRGEVAQATNDVRALTRERQVVPNPVQQHEQTNGKRPAIRLSDIISDTVASMNGERQATAQAVAEIQTTTMPLIGDTDYSKPVTITFPLNEQGRTLARAGLDVPKLKAAGFHFRFTDPKDAAKGGHWEADPTAEARHIAAKLGQL